MENAKGIQHNLLNTFVVLPAFYKAGLVVLIPFSSLKKLLNRSFFSIDLNAY